MALKGTTKGINIEIGGDITGLGKALSGAEKQISGLSGEINEINKQLKFDPSNTVLLTQRTQALSEQYSAVAEKLKLLKSNQDQVNSGFDAQGNAISQTDIRAYNREVETTQNILKNLGQSQDKANKELAAGKAEFTKINPEVKKFGEELDGAKGKSSTFGDVLKANLTSQAIIGAIKTIVNAVKEIGSTLVSTAAEVRAENSQFEQTFGTLGSTAEAAISRVADASGILDTRLKGVGTSIYAFAKSSGAESAQAMSLMERALQAAADGAAYYDKSLEDTSQTLQSFLKGNYANDAALGVSATEFTRNAAAAELFGKKFQDLTEIQKQETLLQMVIDAQALSGAMGQAAREADGLENVKGNLNEILKQIIAIIGQPILDTVVPIIQAIGDKLIAMKPQIVAVADGMYEFFDKVKTVFNNVKAVLTENEGKFETFKNAVIGSIQSMYQRIQPLLNQIKDIFFAVIDLIKAYWEIHGENIKNVIITIFEAVKGIIDGVLSVIEGIVDIGLGIIQGDWERVFKGIQTYTSGVMQNIKSVVQGAVNAVINILNSMITGMNLILKTNIQPIKLWVDEKDVTTVKESTEAVKDNTKVTHSRNKALAQGYAQMRESIKAENDTQKSNKATANSIADVGKSAKGTKKELSELEKELKALENRKGLSEVSPEEELAEFIRIREKYVDKYGDTSDEIIDIDKNIYSLRKNIAEESEKAILKAEKDQQEAEKKSFDNSKKWIENKKKLNELSLTEEIAAWERVQARYAEGTEQRQEADEQLYAARTRLLEEQKKLTDKMTEAEKRYEQAVNSRAQAIYNSFGLFDELKKKEEISGQSLKDNLQSQVEEMENWRDNLAKLSERGVDEGLIAELQNMGPEANAEIKALLSLSNKDLTEYEKLWKEKTSIARTQAVEEMKGLRADINAEIAGIKADLDALSGTPKPVENSDDPNGKVIEAVEGLEAAKGLVVENEKEQATFKESGANLIKSFADGVLSLKAKLINDMRTTGIEAMQGFLNGILAKEPEIMAEAKRIADAVRSTISNALEIHSPSRVMMELGEFTGEGYAIGLENALGTIEKAAHNLGIRAIPNIKNNLGKMPSFAGTGSTIINIEFGDVINNSDKDMVHIGNLLVDTISENLAFREKQIMTGRGKRY